MAGQQPLRACHRRPNHGIHHTLDSYDDDKGDHDEAEQVLREGRQVLVAEEGEEDDHARAGSGQGWDSVSCEVLFFYGSLIPTSLVFTVCFDGPLNAMGCRVQTHPCWEQISNYCIYL